MMPAASGLLQGAFAVAEPPSNTWLLDTGSGTVTGAADGIDAVRQAICLILSTERYQYPIFSWNYGVETADLYGEPYEYVISELERRLTGALLWDRRILEAGGFAFRRMAGKGMIAVEFSVSTVFGRVQVEWAAEA